MKWLRKHSLALLVLGIYCVLTLVMTYPLITQMSTHLAGNDMDVWINPWANWWTRKALAEGIDFYRTEYLFWPHGAKLYFHSFSHFNTGLWMLLQPIIGGIPAQNVTTLLCYILSAFGTYLLVLYLTRNRFAAFVSGFVFSFTPWHIEQSSHPVMNTTQWIPLFMLCLIRALHEKRVRWIVGAAVFLWLEALSSWHLFMFALMLGGMYAFVFLVGKKARFWSTLRLLGIGALIAFLLIGPLMLPLILDYFSGQDYVSTVGGSRPADLLGLITPSHNHPVIGWLMPPGYGPYTTKMCVFVGWTVLVLSVYVSVRLWCKVYFWTPATVTFLIISLGPYLQIGGVKYKSFQFPWGRLIARFFRAPDRFYVLISLALAVLVGYGLAFLASGSRRAGRRTIVAWILSGLMFFEFLYWPFPTLQPIVPRFYEQIANEPGEFAILDIPMGRRREYMYYQTFHERPLVGGTLSRTPSETSTYVNNSPFLLRLREENVMDPTLTDVSRQLMELAEDDIKYLVIHKTEVEPNTLAQWRDYLVIPPFCEDDKLAVYRTYPPHGMAPTLLEKWENGLGLVSLEVGSGHTLAQDSVVEVRASWFATRSLQDLTVHFALEGDAGELVQIESFPLYPDWPTSHWLTGTVASSKYVWRVDPFVPSGDYALLLAVDDASNTDMDEVIHLGQFKVEALPRAFDVPSFQHPVSETFGGDLTLLGYDLDQEPNALHLTLHWRAERRMSQYYKFFVHLLDRDTSTLVAQADWVPRHWTYPTHWWESGEVVSEDITVPLVQVPEGRFTVALGVYVPEGKRLCIQAGADQVVLDKEIVVP